MGSSRPNRRPRRPMRNAKSSLLAIFLYMYPFPQTWCECTFSLRLFRTFPCCCWWLELCDTRYEAGWKRSKWPPKNTAISRCTATVQGAPDETRRREAKSSQIPLRLLRFLNHRRAVSILGHSVTALRLRQDCWLSASPAGIQRRQASDVCPSPSARLNRGSAGKGRRPCLSLQPSTWLDGARLGSPWLRWAHGSCGNPTSDAPPERSRCEEMFIRGCSPCGHRGNIGTDGACVARRLHIKMSDTGQLPSPEDSASYHTAIAAHRRAGLLIRSLIPLLR